MIPGLFITMQAYDQFQPGGNGGDVADCTDFFEPKYMLMPEAVGIGLAVSVVAGAFKKHI